MPRKDRTPVGPAPDCRRCNTARDVAPSRNYGRPDGRWFCLKCGWLSAYPDDPDGAGQEVK